MMTVNKALYTKEMMLKVCTLKVKGELVSSENCVNFVIKALKAKE